MRFKFSKDSFPFKPFESTTSNDVPSSLLIASAVVFFPVPYGPWKKNIAGFLYWKAT